ncbi:hypothetical protein QP948_06345 [Corynebacterium bovis]|nr:hypothetical protein [Corynebacterium bovis]MDK8511020.1 hypothetical protein [Corynebacterium bovis]
MSVTTTAPTAPLRPPAGGGHVGGVGAGQPYRNCLHRTTDPADETASMVK